MDIGTRIKKLRLSRGWTLKQVCDVSTMPCESTLVGWENGRCKPNSDAIVRICHLFGVTPNELFGWDE